MTTKTRSRHAVADAASSTLDELKSLLAEAEKALASAVERPAEEIKALRGRMRGALKHGRVTARHAAEFAREKVALADDAVRTYPYAALGVAAGVGLLLGLVISRSSQSR